MTPSDIVQPLIELSPPVALWAVLNILMSLLKRVPGVKSWTIPFISFFLGGVLYPAVSDPGKVSFAVHSPVVAQFITGLLIGGAAVGSHQLFRQYTSKAGLSFSEGGDTELLKK